LTVATAASGNFDDAGTLNLSGSLSIGAGTTLTFTGNGATTISANIANTTGAVTINDGTGSVTFSGTDAYTGATTIMSGTLSIGGAGQLGSGTYAGNISNAGAFIYNSSAAQTLSGVITERAR